MITSIGVVDFDVWMLVDGGEEDGSSNASLRRAITALNVAYNNKFMIQKM